MAGQTTVALKPTFQTNAINGLPVVRFSGAQCLVSSALIVSAANPRTVVVVYQNANIATNDMGIWSHGDRNNSTLYSLLYRAGGAGFIAHAYHNLTYNSTAPVTSAATLVTSRYDGVTDEVLVNGTSAGTNAVTLNTDNLHAGTVIGALTVGGGICGQYFIGDIAEFMTFTTYLSDTDRLAVETYLKTKYGIP